MDRRTSAVYQWVPRSVTQVGWCWSLSVYIWIRRLAQFSTNLSLIHDCPIRSALNFNLSRGVGCLLASSRNAYQCHPSFSHTEPLTGVDHVKCLRINIDKCWKWSPYISNCAKKLWSLSFDMKIQVHFRVKQNTHFCSSLFSGSVIYLSICSRTTTESFIGGR